MRRADIFIAIEWAELWPWGIGPKIGLRQDRPQQMCLLEICPRKWKAERKHWQWASMPIAKRTLASTISLLLGTLDAYCWRVEAQPSISPSSSECIFASSPTFANKRGVKGDEERKEGTSHVLLRQRAECQTDSRTAAGRKMSHADQAAEEHTRTQIMVTAIIIINDAQRKRWSSDPKTAMLVARITLSPLFREHFTTASVSLSSSSGHVQLAFFLSLF